MHTHHHHRDARTRFTSSLHVSQDYQNNPIFPLPLAQSCFRNATHALRQRHVCLTPNFPAERASSHVVYCVYGSGGGRVASSVNRLATALAAQRGSRFLRLFFIGGSSTKAVLINTCLPGIWTSKGSAEGEVHFLVADFVVVFSC